MIEILDFGAVTWRVGGYLVLKRNRMSITLRGILLYS
jgi:hypothetical protein